MTNLQELIKLREEMTQGNIKGFFFSSPAVKSAYVPASEILDMLIEQMRWIPVSERVPDNGINFDAWHISGKRYADHGAFAGSTDEDFKREVMTINGITHWKPLPPAPDKEST